jgi:4,4'-diaponeurosporenoate glycosyltransferase
VEPTFVLLGAAWFAGWYLCARVPALPLLGDDGATPAISVVVPARDEAGTLPVLLPALAAQTRRAKEVLVVDDESTDGTAAVARDAGARVVTVGADGTVRPGDWTGKAWAMWCGAQAARSEVLVFLDADTEPAPELIARVGALQARIGGLVSVQPYHRTGRLVERLSAMFNVVAIMGVGLASLRPRARQTSAFGPCLVCARADFLARADDPSVRASVLEDVALSRRFRADGEPVRSCGGRDLLAFRMYPRGLGQLVEGWAKNFAGGAASVPATRLVAIVAWITACLVSGVAGVRGVVDLVAGDADWTSAVALLVYVAFALQLWVMFRQLGNFGTVTAALYPIVTLAFVAIFAWSLVNVARGEVHWKGRTIKLRRGAAP